MKMTNQVHGWIIGVNQIYTNIKGDACSTQELLNLVF